VGGAEQPNKSARTRSEPATQHWTETTGRRWWSRHLMQRTPKGIEPMDNDDEEK